MWFSVVAPFYSEPILISAALHPFHFSQAVHALILLFILKFEQGFCINERNRWINPTVHTSVVVSGISWNSVVPVVGFLPHLLVCSLWSRSKYSSSMKKSGSALKSKLLTSDSDSTGDKVWVDLWETRYGVSGILITFFLVTVLVSSSGLLDHMRRMAPTATAQNKKSIY